MNGILSTPKPWDIVASGYTNTTMKMLSQYAEEAICSLGSKVEGRVLDMVCGPGTVALKLASRADLIHAIDFSESMIEAIKQKINDVNLKNVYAQHGDGQALPYDSNSFDAAFSMFGLIFFPDRKKGFSELYRTLKPSGMVAVSSWVPINQSPTMQLMFDVLKIIRPDLIEPESVMESLEDPVVFEKELLEAGFHSIHIKRVQKEFPVESVQKLWERMEQGSAPISLMKNTMDKKEWDMKERLVINHLKKVVPNTPTMLSSAAWLGTAMK